jgi:SPW repeat
MKMNKSNSGDEVRGWEQRLEHMRALQTLLAQAYQREVAAQKESDARALEMMGRDPRGHIQMMKMEQEHVQLALELPRTLLKGEAQVYYELQSAEETTLARTPDAGRMMAHMVAMARWSQIPILPLGLWLIASPFTLGYSSRLLMWSDVIAAILVMALAAITFRSRRVWPAWANTFIGLWLAFAPLLFWTSSAGAFANDTLVGTLVIVFAVLIPMMMQMPGPEVPLGWSYNPSTWLQRAPVMALALLSFLVSRYMAAFQLEHIPWGGIRFSATAQSLFSLRTSPKSFPSPTRVWAPSST